MAASFSPAMRRTLYRPQAPRGPRIPPSPTSPSSPPPSPVFQQGPHRNPGPLLGDLPAPHLAGTALRAWMTTTLHQLPGMDDYQKKMQLAELENTVASTAAATNLSENYVGIPLPAEATSIPWSHLAQHRESLS